MATIANLFDLQQATEAGAPHIVPPPIYAMTTGLYDVIWDSLRHLYNCKMKKVKDVETKIEELTKGKCQHLSGV